MTRVYPPWEPLTRDQIVSVVESALEDGTPVDTAVTEALYPCGAPRLWADWHEEAKSIHLEAIEYHCQRRKSFLVEPVLVQPEKPTPARRRHRITPADGWRVIYESMKAEPVHTRLTWPDIGKRLGVAPRAAEHLIKSRLGFRFSGRQGSRAIVSGPCVECGKLHPAETVSTEGYGPCCVSQQAA